MTGRKSGWWLHKGSQTLTLYHVSFNLPLQRQFPVFTHFNSNPKYKLTQIDVVAHLNIAKSPNGKQYNKVQVVVHGH